MLTYAMSQNLETLKLVIIFPKLKSNTFFFLADIFINYYRYDRPSFIFIVYYTV